MRVSLTRSLGVFFLGISVLTAHFATPAQAAPKEFISLVDQYTRATEKREWLKKSVFQRRIRISVFEHPGSADYVEKLRIINQLGREHPSAAYDLAKGLQIHWESQYWLKLNSLRIDAPILGTQVGALTGLSVLGVSLLRNPMAAPRYFRIIRSLLPMTTTAAGYVAGSAAAPIEAKYKGIPLSPAHLMTLGIPETEGGKLNDEAITRELVALSATAGVVSIGAEAARAIQALRWANAAATPLKINPVILVASLVAGIVVEQGASAGIEHYELHSQTEALHSAALRFQRAILSRDGVEIYFAGDHLADHALALSRILNRPLFELLKNSAEDADLRTIAEQRMQSLRAHSIVLRDGLVHFSRVQGRALAWDILQGDISNDPDLILIQTAALLRISNHEAVSEKADLLMAAFYRDVAVWGSQEGNLR